MILGPMNCSAIAEQFVDRRNVRPPGAGTIHPDPDEMFRRTCGTIGTAAGSRSFRCLGLGRRSAWRLPAPAHHDFKAEVLAEQPRKVAERLAVAPLHLLDGGVQRSQRHARLRFSTCHYRPLPSFHFAPIGAGGPPVSASRRSAAMWSVFGATRTPPFPS